MTNETVDRTVKELLEKASKAWVELRALDALRYASAALAINPDNEEAKAFLRAKKTLEDEAADGEDAKGKQRKIRLWTASDEQTRTVFALSFEDRRRSAVAALSTVYLLVMLGLCMWLVADTWFDRNATLSWFGFDPKGTLVAGDGGATSPTFKLLVSTAIAGAVGGILDGIRSIIVWHAERGAYGWRFIWKDLSLPWAGAAVAILVYFAIRSGTGVLSGDVSFNASKDLAVIPACAIGSIAGFSSRRVFRWLDYQASQIFSTGLDKGDKKEDKKEDKKDLGPAAQQVDGSGMSKSGAREGEVGPAPEPETQEGDGNTASEPPPTSP